MEKDENESIEDYQITISEDIDVLKLIKILKYNKFSENISINKEYTNSLFTPLLSYIIDYLSHNKDKKNEKNLYIGKSELYGIPIVYTLLDKKIYKLFFKKEKGIIEEEKINYEIKPDDPSLIKEINEKEDDFKNILRQPVKEDEEILLENQTIKKVFELKKREIISTFIKGFSAQERVINLLNENSNEKINKLPNVIFFKNNSENMMLSEMDRIITVKQDMETNNDFLVYLKAEVLHETNKVNITEIPKGEILSLKKDSCYFIEVKTSIDSLFDEEKNEEDENEKKEEEKDSKNNKSTEDKQEEDLKIEKGSKDKVKEEDSKKNNRIYRNMKTFRDLFEKLRFEFKSLNLVIIIDSYFPTNFLELSKKFVEIFKKEELTYDFNIYLVHFQVHIEYTPQLTSFEKFRNDLNETNKKILELENNLKIMKKELSEVRHKNDDLITELKKERIKDNKKKIQQYLGYLIEEEIEKNKNKINNEDFLIVTKHQLPGYKCSKKFNDDTKYNNIFDFRNFCLIYYKDDNKDLIEDVKEMHLNNIKKYLQKKEGYKFLLFFVDFVFLYFIKELTKKFDNYNIIVTPEQDSFFIITFEKKNNQTETTFLFEGNILGMKDNLNKMDEFINIKNFTDYYLQSQNIKDQDNLSDLYIYDPKTNGCEFFIILEETMEKNAKDKCLILVMDPVFDYGEQYKYGVEKYKYNFIVFKIYNKKYNEEFINLATHFTCLQNLVFDIKDITDKGKIDFQGNNKYIKIYDNGEACIFDTDQNRLQSRYKINEQNKFDTAQIYDKKYSDIMSEILKDSKKKEIDILIEEPFNLLWSYIEAKKINCSLFLINNSEDEKILDYLGTKSEKQNVDVDIYSYLYTLNWDEFLDFIILFDNHFPDEENDIIPKTLFIDDDKLIIIKEKLNREGKFCFNLLIKNPFLLEKIEKKLKSFFTKVQLIKTNDLDMLVICTKD